MTSSIVKSEQMWVRNSNANAEIISENSLVINKCIYEKVLVHN